MDDKGASLIQRLGEKETERFGNGLLGLIGASDMRQDWTFQPRRHQRGLRTA
ncbi:hypothetical protein HNQ04_001874 [Deinococcus radiopugnans ATCC 19172]|uniref:Transposase n=1 Tax=Deinococcus radiopugnans ATCC 19172 TaxID=585398 RepID=A0ABR6NRF1_9DEIO|nr:hypothetical protein [Deinococcus radiopugnans ATCC 19172]